MKKLNSRRHKLSILIPFLSFIFLINFNLQAQDGTETEATICYDFNDCDATSDDNAGHDFSEFAPRLENQSMCILDLDASNLSRRNPVLNGHSCTTGVDGTLGMCVSSKKGCDFSDNSDLAMRFTVSITPIPGEKVVLNGISFYENAPLNFNWENSASGENNYPQKYGIRVLRDGTTVYKEDEISTTNDYTFEEFVFSGADYEFTEATTYEFELLAYCPIENGAIVSAWDIDDLKVNIGCRNDDPPPPPPPSTCSYCCYNMDDCDALSGAGELAEQWKYDELISKGDSSICNQKVTCTPLYKKTPGTNTFECDDPHSCVPPDSSYNSIALCVEAEDGNEYSSGNELALRFDLDFNPDQGETIVVKKFSFLEAAPLEFRWFTNNPNIPSGILSGPNDYPAKYGVSVLRDGVEVFTEDEQETSFDFTLEEFSFSGSDFEISSPTKLTFVLMAYSTVINPDSTGIHQNVWDLDDIRVEWVCEETFTGESADVVGRISTENNEGLENVEVELKGTNASLYQNTDGNGEFAFRGNLLGHSYLVTPSKNDDVLNGVTTIDLLLMQRHILGLQALDNPYKVIAADVDRSNSVTAVDLLELRKLILGVYQELPENQSWRFVDQSTTFSEANNPWNTEILESFRISNLTADMEIPFDAIKVGDVNNTATNLIGESEVDNRTSSTKLILNNTLNGKANLSVESTEGISAIQFELFYQGDITDIISVNSNLTGFSASNYFINTEKSSLTISWNALNSSVGSNNASFVLNVSDGFEEALVVSQDSRINSEVLIGSELNKLNLIIEGRSSELNTLTLSPNPFDRELNIDVYSTQNQLAKYIITDLSGNKVLEESVILEKGSNRLNSNNSENLTDGIYIIQISLADELLTKKIIKI